MNSLFPTFQPDPPKTYSIDGKEVFKPQTPREGTSGTEVFNDAVRDLSEQKLPNVLPQ